MSGSDEPGVTAELQQHGDVPRSGDEPTTSESKLVSAKPISPKTDSKPDGAQPAQAGEPGDDGVGALKSQVEKTQGELMDLMRRLADKVDRMSETLESLVAETRRSHPPKSAPARGSTGMQRKEGEEEDDLDDVELLNNLVAPTKAIERPDSTGDEDSDSETSALLAVAAAKKKRAQSAVNGGLGPKSNGKKRLEDRKQPEAPISEDAPYGLTSTGRAKKKPGPKPGTKRARRTRSPAPAAADHSASRDPNLALPQKSTEDAPALLPPLEPNFDDIAAVPLDGSNPGAMDSLVKIMRQSRMGTGKWFYRNLAKDVKADGKTRTYLQTIYNRLTGKEEGKSYGTVGEVLQEMVDLYESFMDHDELSGNAWIFKYRKMPDYIEEVRSRAGPLPEQASDQVTANGNKKEADKNEVLENNEKAELKDNAEESNQEEKAAPKEEAVEAELEGEGRKDGPESEGENQEEENHEDEKNLSKSEKNPSEANPELSELEEAPEEDSEEDDEKETSRPVKRARKPKKLSI